MSVDAVPTHTPPTHTPATHTPPIHTLPAPARSISAEPSPRERRRAHIAARLLDGLESLLERNRALLGDPDAGALHVELIAAEVAHELAIARAALRRAPALQPPRPTGPAGAPSTPAVPGEPTRP